MIYFHQMVNGIPLLNHAGATYNQKTRGNAIIRLRGTVINEGMYDISIPSLKTTEKLADDVPLCSLSKVISAIEKEIEAGHIRKIYDLEFGYVFYEDPDYVTKNKQTDHFYAIPVWQLNCLYMSNRQKELPEYSNNEVQNERDSLEYSSLVINAQTGDMQDFMIVLRFPDRGFLCFRPLMCGRLSSSAPFHTSACAFLFRASSRG